MKNKLAKYIKSDILKVRIKSRPIEWVGSSKDDLRKFPIEVKYDIGHALREAQDGKKPAAAKPLKGYKGAGVLEIADCSESGTYRAVYTVKFEKAVYVLHYFQKKSKKGINTPKKDINVINYRLKIAEADYVLKYGKD